MFIEVHPKYIQFNNGNKIMSDKDEACLINVRYIEAIYADDSDKAIIAMDEKIYHIKEYYTTIKNLLIS